MNNIQRITTKSAIAMAATKYCARQIIKSTRSRVFLGVSLAFLLSTGAATIVLGDETAGDRLSTAQIFNKVKDHYASMATYSDEGCVVTTMGTIIHFSTRLARTNYYLIEWQQAGRPPYAASGIGPQAAWSSGAGDFMQAKNGARSQGNREIALTHACSFSGGATATVPRIFFDLRWVEKPLGDSVFSVDRKSDENAGKISCYVFAEGSLGATNTLWIGKQDFLIHQVRTIIDMEGMPIFTATETHSNIVLNRRFSQSDFVPSFSLFESSAN